MSAFLYGTALQWRLDIRSKSLLITCYMVPLIFFAVMGGIFTSVNPEAKSSLIHSMTVMGVSMGAMIGLPPSLVEIYGSGIKKVYKANGVPMYLGLVSIYLSSFVHLMFMSCIILIAAPLVFGASLPSNLPAYFGALAVFTAVSLSVGSILGLLTKNQAKLTMASQLLFLPSILLSGIMFPAGLLPGVLLKAGKILPATWGYELMLDGGLQLGNLCPLLLIFSAAAALCCFLLKRLQAE